MDQNDIQQILLTGAQAHFEHVVKRRTLSNGDVIDFSVQTVTLLDPNGNWHTYELTEYPETDDGLSPLDVHDVHACMICGMTVSLAEICPVCGKTMGYECAVSVLINESTSLICRICNYELFASPLTKLKDRFIQWVLKP